jgi:hypothetical protein
MSYDKFYLTEHVKLLERAGSGHTSRDEAKKLIDMAKISIAKSLVQTNTKKVADYDVYFIMLEAATHSDISDIDFNAYALAKLCMVDEDFKYFVERLITGVSHVSRLWKHYSEAKKQKIIRSLRLAKDEFIVLQ